MKIHFNKTIVAVLFLLLFISKINAQNEAANWIMWPSKFNFNTVPPSSSNQLNDTIIQSSSISDKNGNLLLYTNGFNVWNKNFQKIEGSGNILNNYAVATSGYNGIPCVIVQSPKDSNQFYIFGTDFNAYKPNSKPTISYAIVDLNLNDGLGKVISKQNIIDSNSAKVIAAVKHCNNKDYWIITHRDNTNTFLSILLSKTGVSNTFIESKIGQIYTSYPSNSKIKISPNGKFISIFRGSNSLIQKLQMDLFLFDNKSGEISNPLITIIETNTNNNVIANGIEFSPDNSKFYFANSKSEILQYDLSIIDSQIINTSKTIIAKVSNGQSSAMQLASNNKIYVNGRDIDCIDNPNKKYLECNYLYKVFSIDGYVIYPTLVSSIFNQPAEIEDFCYGSSTIFKILNPSIYDSIRWDFGDLASNKNFSTDTLAYHIYSNYGLFKGVLHMFKCGSESVYNFKVSISKPAKITFNILKPICINDKPFKLELALPDSGIYTLNNQEIDSINPINIGVGKQLLKYQLVNDSGCVSVDSTTIEIKPLPIAKIISSRSPLLCLGDSVIFTTSFSKNYWSTSDSSKSIIVKKAGLYAVSVVDTFGCKNNSDTIKVELKDIPVAEIIASDTLICEGNEFILTATGDGEYTWSNGQKGKQIFVKAKSTETYKLNVTNYCGNDEDTIKITVLRTNTKAYPNPVRNILQVDLNECAGAKQLVELFDESGKLILQFETENNSEKIDMRHFAEGNYLLRLGTSKSRQVFKVQFVN